MDALIWPEVVKHVAYQDVRHSLDCALAVAGVVVLRAAHGIPGGDDVNLAVGVLETQEAAGNYGHDVCLVVDANEIGNLVAAEAPQTRCHRESGGEGGARTLESSRAANAGFPTRGVPYVTAFTWTLDGKLRVINSESSSASAPPSECPICGLYWMSFHVLLPYGPGFRRVDTHEDDLRGVLLLYDLLRLGEDRRSRFFMLRREAVVGLDIAGKPREQRAVQVREEEVDIRKVGHAVPRTS